jgi:hypothetical protein
MPRDVRQARPPRRDRDGGRVFSALFGVGGGSIIGAPGAAAEQKGLPSGRVKR